MVTVAQAAAIARAWTPGLDRDSCPPDWPTFPSWWGVFERLPTHTARETRIVDGAAILAHRINRSAPASMIRASVLCLDDMEAAPVYHEPAPQQAPAPSVPILQAMSPAMRLAVLGSASAFFFVMTLNASHMRMPTHEQLQAMYHAPKPTRHGPGYAYLNSGAQDLTPVSPATTIEGYTVTTTRYVKTPDGHRLVESSRYHPAPKKQPN